MRYPILFLSASALSVAAHAQDAGEEALAEIIAAQDETADPSEAEGDQQIILWHERVVPITVTANGIGTAIDSTGQAVTIIDEGALESVQGADPLRALRRVPGLTATRSGAAGSLTSVNIRGANAEQVLVLVDGVRVSDPASPAGGLDFGNVLTGTASRFDILRGANSTIWGSDAVGGVIDITTRKVEGARGVLEYGARDTLFASAGAGVDEGPAYFSLTGSWFETDGFSAAAAGDEADGFEQFSLAGVTFIDLTDSLELFAHANFSEGDLDIDGFSFSPPFGLIDSGDTQKTVRYWGDVGLAYYGNDLTLRGSYALSDTERVNRGDTGLETFRSDGRNERLALRGEYRLIGGIAFAFGAEHEWSRFATLFDDGAETSTTGAYAQLGGTLGPVSAHIGSRIDMPADFGNEVSFGGDIVYALSDGWRLRASVGEGYKAPTLFQLFSDFGNEELAPENSTSVDIGIEHGRPEDAFHAALSAFTRDSENLIGFETCFVAVLPAICEDGRFGYYQNIGAARARGIEAEASYDLTATMRVSGVYSFIDAQDRETGNRLARRPRHSGTLFADWTSDFGLSLGGDLQIVGDSFDDAGNTTRLDGYALVDIRAAYDLSDTVEVYGRVENAFDEQYQTVAGYGTPGRGAFAGVRVKM